VRKGRRAALGVGDATSCSNSTARERAVWRDSFRRVRSNCAICPPTAKNTGWQVPIVASMGSASRTRWGGQTRVLDSRSCFRIGARCPIALPGPDSGLIAHHDKDTLHAHAQDFPRFADLFAVLATPWATHAQQFFRIGTAGTYYPAGGMIADAINQPGKIVATGD
jgi:hypothetical protein